MQIFCVRHSRGDRDAVGYRSVRRPEPGRQRRFLQPRPPRARNWAFETSPYLGWSGANGVIEIGNSDVYGLPCDNCACQNLEVNDTGPDVDTYTVTGLASGKQYVFSYAYGGRAGNPQTLIVSDGTGYSNTITGSLGSWTPNSAVITAAGTFDTLRFDGFWWRPGGCNSCGNEITNVSFSAVPEASTWAMLLAGFAGLGFFGFRARRAAALTL